MNFTYFYDYSFSYYAGMLRIRIFELENKISRFYSRSGPEIVYSEIKKKFFIFSSKDFFHKHAYFSLRDRAWDYNIKIAGNPSWEDACSFVSDYIKIIIRYQLLPSASAYETRRCVRYDKLYKREDILKILNHFPEEANSLLLLESDNQKAHYKQILPL